jgi:hypothetical protein
MRRVSFGHSEKFLLLESYELAGMVQTHRGILSNCYWGNDSWIGSTIADLQRMIVSGDERRVAESDKYLAEIEDQIPVSRGWRNVDDVVGALPNVPAFLAGHPQCMRRRQRVASETAPLSIYLDLGSSNTISHVLIERRGLVLLALIRLLVEHRPVELWVGSSIGATGYASTTCWRIDTSPLDLARAAYHISATAMSRRFGYGVSTAESGRRWNSAFAMGNHAAQVSHLRNRVPQLFSGDTMFVPPIYDTGNEMVTNPVAWLKRTMAQYVGESE